MPGVELVPDVVPAQPARQPLSSEPVDEAAVGAPVTGVTGHGRHPLQVVAEDLSAGGEGFSVEGAGHAEECDGER